MKLLIKNDITKIIQKYDQKKPIFQKSRTLFSSKSDTPLIRKLRAFQEKLSTYTEKQLFNNKQQIEILLILLKTNKNVAILDTETEELLQDLDCTLTTFKSLSHLYKEHPEISSIIIQTIITNFFDTSLIEYFLTIIENLFQWSSKNIAKNELKNFRQLITTSMCQKPEYAEELFTALEDLYQWEPHNTPEDKLKELYERITECICREPKYISYVFEAIEKLYSLESQNINLIEFKKLRQLIIKNICQQPKYTKYIDVLLKTLEELYQWQSENTPTDTLKNLCQQTAILMCQNPQHAESIHYIIFALQKNELLNKSIQNKQGDSYTIQQIFFSFFSTEISIDVLSLITVCICTADNKNSLTPDFVKQVLNNPLNTFFELADKNLLSKGDYKGILPAFYEARKLAHLYRQAQKSSTSPFNQLPIELLAHICFFAAEPKCNASMLENSTVAHTIKKVFS